MSQSPIFNNNNNITRTQLFDVPVSNNGARIRFIIYKKSLQDDRIDIISPKNIGGLRSEQYLSFNPLGKMPLLVEPSGYSLFESQVIESYLLDKYKGTGPDLIPTTPESRGLASLVVRIHDLYIATIQGCMYKPMETAEARAAQIKELSFYLDVVEHVVAQSPGPFICGEKISYVDSALMPTFVFLLHMLPKYFFWKSVFTKRPRLEQWWNALASDAEAQRVIDEVQGGLNEWEAVNRWTDKGIVQQILEKKDIDWSCGN